MVQVGLSHGNSRNLGTLPGSEEFITGRYKCSKLPRSTVHRLHTSLLLLLALDRLLFLHKLCLRRLGAAVRLPRPHAEQPRQDYCTQRARRLRVDRRDLCDTVYRRCRAHPAEQRIVQVRPVGLRVREGRVERRDERRTPEVRRRPAVGLELGRRGDGEWVGL